MVDPRLPFPPSSLARDHGAGNGHNAGGEAARIRYCLVLSLHLRTIFRGSQAACAYVPESGVVRQCVCNK